MDFILGFIVGISFSVSIVSIIRDNKRIGVVNLILTIITPVVTQLFLQNKSNFVFGGTDFEFLIQTATVDKMIEPWLIILLHIVILTLTIYSIFKNRKNK